jgi:hypothetical protein
MNEKEMIEEMAKIIDNNHGFIVSSVETAQAIYNADYRKIPEGSVVLSKEEYADLQISKDFNYGYHEGTKNMEAYYENIRIPEARKETAQEIFYKLKETLIINNEENTEFFDYDYTLETIDKLAKQYGVEVENERV